jgi:hypothetical protein
MPADALFERVRMEIDKARLVALLRSRGLEDRALWVDRQLPELVDVGVNAALLDTLKITPAEFADLAPR